MASAKPVGNGRRYFRKICFWLLFGGVFMGLFTPFIIAKRTWFINHEDTVPRATIGEPQLEVQTEAFTCGVHAMSTIYRAYGLDPKKENIRLRLGADIKALFWLKDSEGSFHPDAYMIFNQDYFYVDEIAFDHPDPWRKLVDHLATGHMSMILIRREETDGLHWVAARGHNADKIEIFDSLKKKPSLENRSYMQNQMLSAILITPMPRRVQAQKSGMAHAAGVLEMQRSMMRYAAMIKG